MPSKFDHQTDHVLTQDLSWTSLNPCNFFDSSLATHSVTAKRLNDRNWSNLLTSKSVSIWTLKLKVWEYSFVSSSKIAAKLLGHKFVALKVWVAQTFQTFQANCGLSFCLFLKLRTSESEEVVILKTFERSKEKKLSLSMSHEQGESLWTRLVAGAKRSDRFGDNFDDFDTRRRSGCWRRWC